MLTARQNETWNQRLELRKQRSKHAVRRPRATTRRSANVIQIVYVGPPGTGNNTEFSYDGLGRNVKIVEKFSYLVTETRQFVYCGNSRCEERDASGVPVNKFYSRGEERNGTDYFYDLDSLGSVRELIDTSNAVQAQSAYTPFGLTEKLQGGLSSAFQFAGYFKHERSGLNLTAARAYAESIGRFINRDPIEELAGSNLYYYVGNSPTTFVDPSGLDGICCVDPKKVKEDADKWMTMGAAAGGTAGMVIGAAGGTLALPGGGTIGGAVGLGALGATGLGGVMGVAGATASITGQMINNMTNGSGSGSGSGTGDGATAGTGEINCRPDPCDPKLTTFHAECIRYCDYNCLPADRPGCKRKCLRWFGPGQDRSGQDPVRPTPTN